MNRLVLYPAQSSFLPGETVHLIVTLEAPIVSAARLRLSIAYLASTIADLTYSIEWMAARQQLTLTWQPPPTAPRGYGVEAELIGPQGEVLAAASTAFDVLDRWTQAPRYGFLTDFAPGRSDVEATLDELTRFHINGLQFYDWMYRHDHLLAPTEEYRDPLDRPVSLTTIRALIQAAHRRGIAALPYTAIYAASPEFYRAHPTWALFRADGQPLDFAGGFLIYMNPAAGSPWSHHLLEQFETVLRRLDFDGIHLDQYGDPIAARDAIGQIVALDQTFPVFVDAAAQRARAIRRKAVVVFNCVAHWPIQAIARSEADFMYIEVWKPDTAWRDLWRIIVEARRLSEKPAVLAAYIDPMREYNVRLADAIIFASGGYHIELGEKEGMLSDPYFPKYGQMSEALKTVLRAYYDFAVRYENVLALGTHDATSAWADRVSIDGVALDPQQPCNTLWPIVCEGDGFTSINLINLLGIASPDWTEALMAGPTPLEPFTVRIRTDRPMKKVWWASPDESSAHAVSVPVEGHGAEVTVALPGLKYWMLILIEWEQ